jgi:hypothetical protein
MSSVPLRKKGTEDYPFEIPGSCGARQFDLARELLQRIRFGSKNGYRL